MWDSKTVVGCCKLVCVLLYSTSTCYEEGLVNFLVDPIVRTFILHTFIHTYIHTFMNVMSCMCTGHKYRTYILEVPVSNNSAYFVTNYYRVSSPILSNLTVNFNVELKKKSQSLPIVDTGLTVWSNVL